VPPNAGVAEVTEALDATLETVELSRAGPIPDIALQQNTIYPFLLDRPIPVTVVSQKPNVQINFARLSEFKWQDTPIRDEIRKYLEAFRGPAPNPERVCEKCQHRGALESNFVVKFSPVIVLHIQKTRSAQERKNAVPPIEYPDVLDLALIADGECPKYRLFGVVDHVGDSVNHGHYIAHAYHHGVKEWLTFNDVMCLKGQPYHTANAYLLLYERIDS
jgi:hypothetical protein